MEEEEWSTIFLVSCHYPNQQSRTTSSRSLSTPIFATFYGSLFLHGFLLFIVRSSFPYNLPKMPLLIFQTNYIFVFRYMFLLSCLRWCSGMKLPNIVRRLSLSECFFFYVLFSKNTGNSVSFIYYKELSLYSIRVIFKLLESVLHYRDTLVKREIFV